MLTQAVASQLFHDLMLARLLPGKKPPTIDKFRKYVEGLGTKPINEEQWETLLRELVDAGLLTRKPWGLTDAGRQRALAFLQLDGLPPKMTWAGLKGQFLVPRVLRLAPEATALRKKLKNKEGLCAYLVQQRFELPAAVRLTPSKVLEALACRLICRELNLAAEAADLAPSGSLSSLTRLAKQLPKILTGKVRVDADSLRDAILRDRLEQTDEHLSHPPHHEETKPTESGGSKQIDMDLPVFASTVQAVARTCPTGHWGDNKVFISHVWRQLQQEPNFPRLDLAAFKERLVEAHQRGLLLLERADLVEAMNPEDVRESETTFLTATYHFILIEKDRL